MHLFTPLFSMFCAAAMTLALPVVPGSVSVIANNGATSIFAISKISYAVNTAGVPLSDSQFGKTLIGIEIRGTKPGYGSRGWIATVMVYAPLSSFSGKGEWAIPAEYAGFNYFLRANLCFEKACDGSSNFQTSGTSQQFAIVAGFTPVRNPAIVPGSVSVNANNGATSIFAISKISYAVNTAGVPLSDSQFGKTLIGIEIRGNKPGGGSSGWIAIAMQKVPLSSFSGKGEWAIPAEYAGFSYFLRANLCFEKACDGSSNFQTSGSSQQFAIIAGFTPVRNPTVVPGAISVIANNGATSICERTNVRYAVNTTGVPLSDSQFGKTLIGIEIRGNKPAYGPRGWIATVMVYAPLSSFSGKGEWAIPAEYAGFTYFLRANLCFEKSCDGSSNSQNSGSSQQFAITA